MPEPATSSSTALAPLLPRLMSFARLAESLANRFKGVVLLLALSGLLAAAWLTFCALQAFSVKVAAMIGLLLVLPALVLCWCWYILDEACGLPQRLMEWLNRARSYGGETRLQEARSDSRGRFRDLRQLGGLAFDLYSMGADARDLLGVLGGTLALTNPLFLFALAGAALLVGGLDFGAVIAGIVYLWH